MRFYDIGQNLQKLIEDRTVRPYIRISVEIDNKDVFVNDNDILECEITSYREVDSGIINRGTLLLDNSTDTYIADNGYEAGCTMSVWYCFNDNNNCYRRFVLLADAKGFQEKNDGLSRIVEVKLTDLSEQLADENTQADWTRDATYVHTVVCDKDHPEISLVHLIASRAGLTVNDIDCAYLPFNITYTKLTGSVWDELSELARAYKANLECSKDKPISFTESPYDTLNNYSEESGFYLTENELTRIHRFNEVENFANSIRLKYTHYTLTERQELWKYKDSGVWYDDDMIPYFPCTDDTREIFQPGFEAEFTARNKDGKNCTVVYSEEVDNQEQFEANIETLNNAPLTVKRYDITTHKDKALLQLDRNNTNIAIKTLKITGKAIISEPNFCVYKTDTESVLKDKLLVKNITNKYLSDDLFDGLPFYEKRTNDELLERTKKRTGFYITTNLAIIHARAGACIDILPLRYVHSFKTRITELTFSYKKNRPFETRMWTETV